MQRNEIRVGESSFVCIESDGVCPKSVGPISLSGRGREIGSMFTENFIAS